MGELLNSLDVVNKAFKKVMRGYDSTEVDDFLDKVAESLQSYVQLTKEQERRIDEQAEKLDDYEKIKNSLHEALLMAQRTAEEKVSNAVKLASEKMADAAAKADDILAEAKIRAERIVAEAEEQAAARAVELRKLGELRSAAFSHVRSFAQDVISAVERAEREGTVEIPDFAIDLMRKRDMERDERASRLRADSGPILVEHHHAEFISDGADGAPEPSEEAKKAEISDTLSALGIDPDLMSSEV